MRCVAVCRVVGFEPLSREDLALAHVRRHVDAVLFNEAKRPLVSYIKHQCAQT